MTKKTKELAVILLADDDEEDRMLAEEALEECRLSYQLKFAIDGEETLDYLNNRGRFSNLQENPLPELILLDLNMPKKDGREVLAEIKSDARFSSIPVVVLTTSDAAEDISQMYHMGVNSYITKPTSYGDLVNVMESLKSYWFEVVTLPNIPSN